MHRLVPFGLVFFAVFGSASFVDAANKIWTSAVSGDFTETAKWTGGVPGAADTATFNAAGTYIITFDNAPVALVNPVLNQDLFFQAGTVTFTSGAGGPYTYRLTGAGGDDAVITGGSLTLGTSGNPLHLTVDDDLRIRGNASLLARFGSDITTNDLFLGDSTAPAGDGTLTIDGSGSLLTVNGSGQLGAGGETGTLTVRNLAQATVSGTLTLANSSIANTTGVLNLESGARLNAGNISLATTGGIGTSATLDIHDAIVIQTGASTLTVGHASIGTASIDVRNLGVFTTGTGLMKINATGSVTVGSETDSGEFNANGDVTIDGGTLDVGRVGAFVLADGKTMNIMGGGLFRTASFEQLAVDATFNISGANSKLEATRGLYIDFSDVNVSDGGNLSTTSPSSASTRLDIGSLDGNGTLTVDGTGSLVTAGNGSWGDHGFGATVTFRNNASGTFDSLSLAGDDNAGTNASLTVESGADFVADHLSLVTSGASASANFGLVQITGAGSSLTLSPGGMLKVGHGSTGNADVGVHSGGSLVVGAGGSTTLNLTGEILINGGSADLQTLIHNGGKINFVAGSLSYVGSLRVGTGGLLSTPSGTDVTLESNRQLSVTRVSIDAGSTLTLNGGTLNADRLDISGAFHVNSGTLGISFDDSVAIQPTGVLQTSVSINGSIHGLGSTSVIDITSNGVRLGSVASLSGFQHEGTLNVGAHTLTLNSSGYARLGALTTLNGGTINAPNGVAFATGSNFQGHGTIGGRIVGELGSVIEADGPLSLGNATHVAAFNFDGELRVNTRTVTINSTSPAGLGNLTHMGVALSPGTLNAANGFVLDLDEAIVGYGTVNSTNTLAKRSIVNGTVLGNSMALPITFTGYLKGVGSFDNVVFAGTFDPGLSPTIITGGSMTFASTNTLNIEIGGTTRGSLYDAIVANGTLGLNGALAIAFIDGFTAAAGNSFDILDWGALVGTFDTLQLPSLGGGLAWDTSQLYTTGVLAVIGVGGLAGDYNQNGVVDAADYVVWRKKLGSGSSLANDDTPGVGPDDYARWRASFGRRPSASSNAAGAMGAIPEPGSGLLSWWVMFTACCMRFTRSLQEATRC